MSHIHYTFLLSVVEVDGSTVSLTTQRLLLSSPSGLIPFVARQGSIPPGIGFHILEAEAYTRVTFINSLRPWSVLDKAID